MKLIRFLFNKKAISLVTIVASFVLIAYFWWHSIYFPSTDDAYTNANQISVMSEVTGKINQVYVSNNQYIKKDQLLFSIDPTLYRLAVSNAELKLVDAQNDAIKLNQELIAAKAEYQTDIINLSLKSSKLDRAKSLKIGHFISDADIEILSADVENAKQQIIKSKSLIDQIILSQKQQLVNIEMLKNSYAQAKLDLNHTNVYAPFDGMVNAVTLHTGQVITANTPLFLLIDRKSIWVDANFQENQLERIKIGQSATISLDVDNKTYLGTVESISSASGASLSLLPAENYSANWVKVTQRIPVKIKFSEKGIINSPPVGSSATITVNTLS